mgnify:CR=1 FL=1
MTNSTRPSRVDSRGLSLLIRVLMRCEVRAQSSHRSSPLLMSDLLESLPIYRLVDVLASLPMPPGTVKCSRKWRCRIAPSFPELSSSTTAGGGTSPTTTSLHQQKMLSFFHLGVPCFGSAEQSKPVHRAAPDMRQFISDPRWRSFPKPKIAFVGGWAAPGTDMEAENMHELINAFDDVLTKREKILNLQFFHRTDPESHPPIPNLSELLVWPSCLRGGLVAGTSNADAANDDPTGDQLTSSPDGGPVTDVLRRSVVCDNATRVSQLGAVTWWHLDDSGEFVMQTGLPESTASSSSTSSACSTSDAPLSPHKGKPTVAAGSTPLQRQLFPISPEAHPPVKVFIYGPRASYDWLLHDHYNATADGKVVALNIFEALDEDLPEDENDLPIVTVAVLQAGGLPLISPPNIPHVVITVRDCVMVEQRRVCNLFLDEVCYLLRRADTWEKAPIIYQYLRTEMQSASEVRRLVGCLVRCGREFLSEHAGVVAQTVDRLLLMRIAQRRGASSLPPQGGNMTTTTANAAQSRRGGGDDRRAASYLDFVSTMVTRVAMSLLAIALCPKYFVLEDDDDDARHHLIAREEASLSNVEGEGEGSGRRSSDEGAPISSSSSGFILPRADALSWMDPTLGDPLGTRRMTRQRGDIVAAATDIVESWLNSCYAAASTSSSGRLDAQREGLPDGGRSAPTDEDTVRSLPRDITNVRADAKALIQLLADDLLEYCDPVRAWAAAPVLRTANTLEGQPSASPLPPPSRRLTREARRANVTPFELAQREQMQHVFRFVDPSWWSEEEVSSPFSTKEHNGKAPRRAGGIVTPALLLKVALHGGAAFCYDCGGRGGDEDAQRRHRSVGGYCGVVLKNFSPVFGPKRSTALLAVRDLKALQASVATCTGPCDLNGQGGLGGQGGQEGQEDAIGASVVPLKASLTGEVAAASVPSSVIAVAPPPTAHRVDSPVAAPQCKKSGSNHSGSNSALLDELF